MAEERFKLGSVVITTMEEKYNQLLRGVKDKRTTVVELRDLEEKALIDFHESLEELREIAHFLDYHTTSNSVDYIEATLPIKVTQNRRKTDPVTPVAPKKLEEDAKVLKK